MLTGNLPEQVDHRKLANGGVALNGAFPVRRFSRLTACLANDEGLVHVSLGFGSVPSGVDGQDRNRTRLTGQLNARVNLVCRRCLGNLGYDLDCGIDAVLVEDEAALEELPLSEDGILCEGRIVKIADLIEDDLILALPMVPGHTDTDCRFDGAACAPGSVGGQDEMPSESWMSDDDRGLTHRPFAGLPAQVAKKLS